MAILADKAHDRDQGIHILTDNFGKIDRFAMQVPRGGIARILPTLRTLLPALRAGTMGEFACATPAEAERLRWAIRAWKLSQPERFRVHVWNSVASLWARDSYVAARDAQGTSVLFQQHYDGRPLGGDGSLPQLFKQQIPGLRCVPAALDWEGGDLVAGRQYVFVGPSTVRRISKEMPAAATEAKTAALTLALGKAAVLVLPPDGSDRLGDGVQCHLDMFFTILHDDAVLLGDIGWGKQLVSRMHREGFAFPPSEFTPVDGVSPTSITPQALEAIRKTLTKAGLRVHRVPLYPVPRQLYTVTYNNVIQEQTPAGPTVYLPAYGAGPLDGAAREAYERLGYKVHPVDVRHLYQHKGALRCVVNVLERSPLATTEE